jgi:hypothetical protein
MSITPDDIISETPHSSNADNRTHFTAFFMKKDGDASTGTVRHIALDPSKQLHFVSASGWIICSGQGVFGKKSDSELLNSVKYVPWFLHLYFSLFIFLFTRRRAH